MTMNLPAKKASGVQHLSRRFFYKRAVFVNYDGELEPLLAELANKLPAIGKRRWRDDPEDADKFAKAPDTWLNSLKYSNETLLGSVVRHVDGVAGAAFHYDEEADEIPMASLAGYLPPGTQVPECQGYFAVNGNHVIVMPGGSLNAGQMQVYLEWLLQKTELLKKGQQLTFQDKIPKATLGKLRKVNKVSVQFPVLKSPKTSPILVGHASPAAATIRGAMAIAKELGDVMGSLSANEVREFEKSSVLVEFRLGGRLGSAPTSALDGVVSLIPDDMYRYTTINVSGLGTVNGDDLKITAGRSVKYEGGIAVRTDIAEKMRLWLQELIKQGRVIKDEPVIKL